MGMQQIRNEMLVDLNEVQMDLALIGDDEACDKVRRVKQRLLKVNQSVTGADPQIAKVVAACRKDAVSSLMALRAQLTIEMSEEQISDEYLQMAGMAAEFFVRRVNDFVDSSATLARMEER